MTVCAMLSALGVVLLFAGSLIEVMDISMAVIASLLCVFTVIEYGKAAPWLVFAVTGTLSLILLPVKTPAVMYVCFFGYYPILKEKLEKMRRGICWLLKELIFHAAMIIMIVGVRFLLLSDDFAMPSLVMTIAFVLIAEVTFVLYDIALSRLITFYVVRLRKRFKLR